MKIPFPENPTIGEVFEWEDGHVMAWTGDHGWQCLPDCPQCEVEVPVDENLLY